MNIILCIFSARCSEAQRTFRWQAHAGSFLFYRCNYGYRCFQRVYQCGNGALFALQFLCLPRLRLHRYIQQLITISTANQCLDMVMDGMLHEEAAIRTSGRRTKAHNRAPYLLQTISLTISNSLSCDALFGIAISWLISLFGSAFIFFSITKGKQRHRERRDMRRWQSNNAFPAARQWKLYFKVNMPDYKASVSAVAQRQSHTQLQQKSCG